MTQSLRNLLTMLCIGCFITGAPGCHDHETTSKDQQATAVLHRFPFSPLTDSLDQHQGNDMATLYFKRAELLSRNNLHELAADDYKKSWDLRPDEATGLRYVSTLTIIGQTAKAIQLLQDCQKKFPTNSSFPEMLGELYQQSGKMKEAVSIYDNILQADSLNFEAWYEKGLLLEKNGDTTGAIQSLKRAYAIQPVNTYGLELAHLYAEKKDPAALSLCDAVLRKDSTHELLDPFFIKGIYFSNTLQYKKAITQFDSCINRDWKFTDAYLEKGIALFKQKQYDLALQSFRMTIKVSDTYPDGYFWIGRCFEATGDKTQAILYYQQALGLDKDFTEAADAIKRLQ
jgi:tetratricopeptide (TPR) repeat protein